MVSFNNTEYAFAYKSNTALKKANFLFASMGKPWLVNFGLKVLPLAIKWRIPFTKTIIKNTIFGQFVGGETLQETATVANTLGKFNVNVILDYGVEGGQNGEEGYNNAMAEFVSVIDYAATQNNIPYMSIKVTGLVSFELLESLDGLMNAAEGTLINRYNIAKSKLVAAQILEWDKAVDRFMNICRVGAKKGIGVLVDAEETWIQDPVDAITMLAMDEFNKIKPVVYNTIQLYRHDRLTFLKACHIAATERNFILAVKLVRGAYMEKERNRAIENNYISPIQPSKQICDTDYNAAVNFCISHISNTAIIVATHNEDSNLLAAKALENNGIAYEHKHIHFSQLYGMSDNITFNLAKNNFNVSKYLPFGPIGDVIPYLMRRAQENSSVSGQMGRELGLIKKELVRRKV